MRNVSYEAKVTLVGVTPMLMHKAGNIDNKSVASATTDYSEEWVKTCYTNNGNGNIMIPSMNIEAMLMSAGKGKKLGKQFLSRIMATGARLVEFDVPLMYDGEQVTIGRIRENNWLFTCNVKINKATVMRTRSCIPMGWSLTFTIQILNPLLKPEILRQLLDEAGYEVGMFDWRPGSPKPGKFGQFELAQFEVAA